MRPIQRESTRPELRSRLAEIQAALERGPEGIAEAQALLAETQQMLASMEHAGEGTLSGQSAAAEPPASLSMNGQLPFSAYWLRTVLEHLPVGVWLADPMGKIFYGNPAGQRIWQGAQYVELPEIAVYKAYWAETGEPVQPEEWGIYRAITRSEVSLNELLEIECFDGSRKTIRNSALPIWDENDHLLGAVAVNEDLSDLMAAEAQLKRYAAELERSNRELQEFAFIASHDLQEPLRKVIGFGSRLKSNFNGQLNEENQDYLNRLLNAAERMQKMINDLLAFARITTQADPFQPVDLTRAATEALADLELRIDTSGAEVEIGSLPTIEAEPLQMRQVLLNLIGNALKFHQPGIAPRVQVRAAQLPGGWVELSVADNGIGIEERFFERIFQPFQRLHGRGEYEGSGMGLPLCSKIVERHGGTIRVESTPGEGSRFIVLLPEKQ